MVSIDKSISNTSSREGLSLIVIALPKANTAHAKEPLQLRYSTRPVALGMLLEGIFAGVSSRKHCALADRKERKLQTCMAGQVWGVVADNVPAIPRILKPSNIQHHPISTEPFDIPFSHVVIPSHTGRIRSPNSIDSTCVEIGVFSIARKKELGRHTEMACQQLDHRTEIERIAPRGARLPESAPVSVHGGSPTRSR